jgi:hypothetical protein
MYAFVTTDDEIFVAKIVREHLKDSPRITIEQSDGIYRVAISGLGPQLAAASCNPTDSGPLKTVDPVM